MIVSAVHQCESVYTYIHICMCVCVHARACVRARACVCVRWGGGCLVHCGIFISIPCFYQLDTSSIPDVTTSNDSR